MDLKLEIINKAEELFLKYGIKSVSMDDLSRELGISKKTLYTHFANKNELVETVIESHVEREQVFIKETIDSSVDALDELKKISAFALKDIEEVSPSTVYDLQKYYRKSFDILMNDHTAFIIKCFTQNIIKGIAEGLYRENINPLLAAKIYAKSSLFILDELSVANIDKRGMIEEMYNYHVHAIATSKGINLWRKYSKPTVHAEIE